MIKGILLTLLVLIVASVWWLANSNWEDLIVAPSPDERCILIYSIWPMFDLTRERVSLECEGKRRRLWSHSDSNLSLEAVLRKSLGLLTAAASSC